MATQSTLELARQADRIELAAFADMYAAAPPEARASVERVADATLLIAPALPLGLFNRAIGLASSGPVLDDNIREIARRYESAGSAKYFIHIGPTSDLSLEPQLKSLGFEPGEPPLWAKTALRGEPQPLATDLEVRPIQRAEVAEFVDVVCTAFNMPPLMRDWISALANRTNWTGFGAFDGSRMIADGMRWQGAEGSWLGMAGTLPEARGRGAQGALLRARSAGSPGPVITETWVPPPGGHNTSLANMHRAGFATVAERANYQKQR
jgi:hypothetical protein